MPKAQPILNTHGVQPHRRQAQLTDSILSKIEQKRAYDKARYERLSKRAKRDSPEHRARVRNFGVHKRKTPGWSVMTKLLNSYRRTATIKGFGIDITKEDVFVLMQSPCHYCGAPPSQIGEAKANWAKFRYNGLDRVDNLQGYTKDNTVPCCGTCNRAKRDMPLEKFLAWMKGLIEFRTQQPLQ